MKYIVPKVDAMLCKTLFLKQRQELIEFGSIIELTDDKLVEIKERVTDIEPDYELLLKKVPFTTVKGLIHLPIIVATIGNRVDSAEVSYEYDFSSQKWEEKNIKEQHTPWICCYSSTERIYSSEYLMGIEKLHQIAKQLKRTLVIVSHIESQLPYFKSHSLMQEIFNLYLETYKSICINSVAREEIYQYECPLSERNKFNEKRMIYTHKSEAEVKLLIKKCFRKQGNELLENKSQMSLYQDNFYDRIPLSQRIYVPLNLLDDKDYSYYQELGLRTVCVGKNYTFIYDERQKIDSFRQEIAHHVPPNYMSPILTPALIQKEEVKPLKAYNQVSQELKYLGESVYIGIIGTKGVDYRKSYLRNESGTTRIACMWEQKEGNEGIYYTSNQINAALALSNPGESVPLPASEEDETLILQIAGGKDEQYRGIATHAEFIVAKINKAPEAINRIYGGVEEQEGVLMPEVLVAVHKLMELAQLNNKPIVIYIPYSTNISAHDGSSIIEQMLSQLARKQNYTFIMPTGEEGDKNHHSILVSDYDVLNKVSLQVKEQTPYLVGIIYIKCIQNTEFMLYPPKDNEHAIKLERKAITNREKATIYSTGLLDDYNNGSQYILFSIENMTPGTWTIEIEQQVATRGMIDLWLSQQQLNPNVTLSPATPFTTLGSNATTDGIISVSGFDGQNFVILRSAGRGFNWNGITNPICVSRGISVLISDDRWNNAEGTAIAASTLLGSIACLYDKWQVEMGEPGANSLIMRNLILSNVYQFEDVTYPDRSQGYGVYQLERLPQVLATPID